MAEPVFDEHPLGDYLKQTGEGLELMPGGMSDMPVQDEIMLDDDSEQDQDLIHLLPSPLGCLVERCALKYGIRSTNMAILSFPNFSFDMMLNPLVEQLLISFLRLTKITVDNHKFAERFKYAVISSSLLSSTLALPTTPNPMRRSFSPELRDNVVNLDELAPPKPDHKPTVQTDSPTDSNLFAVALLLAVISLSFGFMSLTVLFGSAAYYLLAQSEEAMHQSDASDATMDTLKELISACDVWDSAVNEAITHLEKDERSVYHSPTSPSSPSSPLRVALHSSLRTTQTQSDNVRPLLAALTAEDELTQLAEMYAPSSPITSHFGLDQHRPMSLPTNRRSMFMQPPADKRATWNGSYAALAMHGSPSKHVLRRSEKRRSDLSALLHTSSGPSKHTSFSEPSTPLEGVQEEGSDGEPGIPHGEFGMDALELRRRRRASGMEVLGLSSPRRKSMLPRGTPPTHPSPLTSSPSRFTSMQTSRHPLSLSSLTHSLQGALSAKRYAAAHLLALRFDEAPEPEGGYWEDVRAVMKLLASALADASARLVDALDAAEGQRLRDETPSPVPDPPLPRRRRTITSFAPMPSHLARFASHVDSIASALDDARTELERCVAALREPARAQAPQEAVQDAPALLAYERLRRELGLALRECERGRERLLDIIAPPKDADAEERDEEQDDVPPLGADLGSDDSDKTDSLRSHPSPAQEGPEGNAVLVHSGPPADEALDDASLHLLLAASARDLPPPGIEQVFEAEVGGAVPFVRERSKLTREERIRIAKMRRESGGSVGLGLRVERERETETRVERERWGPGGDVVEELKDVIWKVGERRRRLAERRVSSESGGSAPEAEAFVAPSHVLATLEEREQEGGERAASAAGSS